MRGGFRLIAQEEVVLEAGVRITINMLHSLCCGVSYR